MSDIASLDEIKELEEYIAMAFCIDGECKYRTMTELVNGDDVGATFELSDSKRGKFAITIWTKKDV
jgi:hypothetical protein